MYSIKYLELLTGIKAHTIRMWEKRYGIISPRRTETNIRKYDDCSLKKLLNIAVLNRYGFKISKLAELSDIQLCKGVVSLDDRIDISSIQIEYLLISMIDLDEVQFKAIIDKSIAVKGIDDTVKRLIYPFYDRVAVLWQTGVIHPAHEHFTSNLIRQKLFLSIDRTNLHCNDNTPKVISFLHEKEVREIRLLFFNYQAKKSGLRTIYLGQIVPMEDLKKTCEKIKPDYLMTSFTTSMPVGWVENYIDKLACEFSDLTIFINGIQHKIIDNLPSNVELIDNMESFDQTIRGLIKD